MRAIAGSDVVANLAATFWMVRGSAEAEAEYRRAFTLDADNLFAARDLSNLRLYRQGDVPGAWAVSQGDHPQLALQRVGLLRLQRRDAEALRLLAAMPDSVISSIDPDTPKAYRPGRLSFESGHRGAADPLLRQAKTGLEARVDSLPASYASGQFVRMTLTDVSATRDSARQTWCCRCWNVCG